VNHFSIFYVECRCIGYDIFSWLGVDGLKYCATGALAFFY
jgi:hypothetical protein